MHPDVSAFYRRGKLTDSMMSKAILAPIAGGFQPPAALVQHLGIEAELPRLAELYRAHSQTIDADTLSPKYLPFYHAIRSHFDSFNWEIQICDDRPQVKLEKPYINFVRPSLLTLLTCALRNKSSTTPAMKVHYPSTRGLPDALVTDFYRVLRELSFYLPSDDYIAAIADGLLRGLAGETITLVSPVCPDYAFRQVKERYRYTFDQLGDGVGLVAGRIVATLPHIQDVLTRHGIRTRMVIAAGDFEGLDEPILKRLHETRASFRAKLERSQQRIIEAIGRPLRAVFIADLAGGEAAWRELTGAAYRSISGGDFGGLLETRIDIDSILDARMPLYQAWHGTQPRQKLAEILLRQCAEYSAMGAVFHRNFENPMVIGGDHHRMMPFYWLYHRVPVLYLRRVY
ncbi:MAG: hypothetical protein WD448_04670 [Woeseia sp.]